MYYIRLTEKLSHLYIAVYVTLGVPLTGTLGLKNCKLLLSPTSSAFILSAALTKEKEFGQYPTVYKLSNTVPGP